MATSQCGISAQLPVDEVTRLQALESFRILDSLPEQSYDDIVTLAAHICDVPVALISLIDSERQWFKAKVGVEVQQTPREQAFCAHAILNPADIMEVPDATLDPRFANNPLVTGEPGIRFYAGAPLVTLSGSALGTLCIIDRVPRRLTPPMAKALKALARQVVRLLELRRALAELETLAQAQQERQQQLEVTQKRLDQVIFELAQQTMTDSLTGLKNRRAFDQILMEDSSRMVRTQSSLALILLDIDGFKAFNDEFGHVSGDEALQQLARVLQSQARAYDRVARYGGEEFAIVLPDTSMAEALGVAERIRQEVQDAHWPHRPVTVSLGVAAASASQDSLTLVARADKALYRAKQTGRNRAVRADEAF